VNAAELLPLVRVYDLSDPAGWQAARRHRGFWGVLYTEIHTLDTDHVALVFRPAPDERWRAWERVRLQWILEDRGRERAERLFENQHNGEAKKGDHAPEL
jgi:hypothetical protein